MEQNTILPHEQRGDTRDDCQDSQPFLPPSPGNVPPVLPTVMSKKKWKAFFCGFLHSLLVAVHVVLLVVSIHHYEHAVTMDLNNFSTTWVPLVVSVVSQIVATLYLALLVLVTQSLALRRNLLTCQTLTSIHDKSNAWLGIGSALTSVWQQTGLLAAPWGVSSIALYLAGISTVHVTMTNLFHVVPYNATSPTTWTTKLANASFTAGEASSYDILLFYNQFFTTGLTENMVYDIVPPVPSATGNTTVNASLYEADCAAVPQSLRVSGLDADDSPESPTTFFSLDIGDVLTDIVLPLPYYPAVYGANLANAQIAGNVSCYPSGQSASGGSCWKPIVMAATIPIIDSSGSQAPSSRGPWIPINPMVLQPLVLGQSNENISSVVISGLQLVICSISIRDIKINVSAETQQPFSPPPYSVDVLWKNWTFPQGLPTYDPRLIAAQTVPAFSPSSGHSNRIHVKTGNINETNATAPIIVAGIDPTYPLATQIISQDVDVTLTPSAFDVFVTEDLGLNSSGGEDLNVTLSDLNRSIGRALAAIAWYGSNINYSNIHAASDVLQSQDQTDPLLVPTDPRLVRPTGEATILVQIVRYRLNLSPVPVIIGLAVSVVLLVLSFILIGQPFFSRGLIHAHSILKGSGMLELIWLLGNEPHLSKVRNPEVQTLRAAGMFEVQMSERVEEKVLRALAEEDVEDIHMLPHTVTHEESNRLLLDG